MQAQDPGAAAAIVLDQVHLPARALRVERAARQFADQGLERLLVPRLGQFGPAHVPVQVEVLVLDPARAERIGHRTMTKAVERQQSALDHTAECREPDPPRRDRDADDHHRVVGPIHAQPGRVHGGHALVAGRVHAAILGHRPAVATSTRRMGVGALLQAFIRDRLVRRSLGMLVPEIEVESLTPCMNGSCTRRPSSCMPCWRSSVSRTEQRWICAAATTRQSHQLNL
jgi:hypothetical protein